MSKWKYVAERLADGTVTASIVIDKDGQAQEFPLHHFVKHSPTGFEIGYGGSGPADLAYSILVHWFLSYKFTLEEAQEEAWAQHQDFKWAFVAKEREHLVISDEEVGKWWMDKEIGQAAGRLRSNEGQATAKGEKGGLA